MGLDQTTLHTSEHVSDVLLKIVMHPPRTHVSGRRCRIVLVAAIALLVGIPSEAQVIDRPVDPELRQAFTRYDAALQAGDLESILEHALQVAELIPGLGTPEYNVACAQARLGRTDAALDWLERAIDCGYDDPEVILADGDLTGLHDRDRFEALVDRAREQHAKPVFSHVPSTVTVGKPAIVFVVLHNFGGNARSIGRQWTSVADRLGAIVLAPKAPAVITPAQARWTSSDQAESIVLAQLAELEVHYSLDPTKTVLIGIGQGAELAYAIGLAHPERFGGIVAVAGRLPETGLDTLRQDSQHGRRVFILVGRGDREEAGSRIAAESLRAAGVDVRLGVYEAGRRFLPAEAMTVQSAALDFVLHRRSGASSEDGVQRGGSRG